MYLFLAFTKFLNFIYYDFSIGELLLFLMATTSQPSQQYFTIEGNIGCGKTTFLNMLKKHCPEIQFLAEPVDEWRNVNNTNINILQSYYEDSHRWGLTFLNYALLTRIKSYHDLR